MDLLQIYKDQNDDEIDKLEDQFQDPHSTASSPEASTSIAMPLTPLPLLATITSVILMPCKRVMPSLCTTSHSTSRRRGRLKRRKQRRRKVMATKKTSLRLSRRIGRVRGQARRKEECAKKKGGERERGSEKGEILPDKSTFHGKEERDYQGRSWIAPPKDAKANNDHCYVPKRLVHTWSDHTKGVSAIRFFPKQGHLILSAGMDAKVKIWDVFNSGKCMRTYMGHSKAVRDIWFCNDGTKFLTAGYDKNIKYWDTETGQVISTFSTGRIPYVVRLKPDDDKQNILLAGMSDKKIVQWDMNTGQVAQEYDQHLGAVNTITFVDNNRRFVSSSDDKSLRVWEFGIPVVIKYISEPHMHSMPSISLHPSTNYLAAQSLDNQILTYSTRDRFQLNKEKKFWGHIVAGYACQVNFSPDGRFIMSGDGEGKCWFWNWKTRKVFKPLKCHEGACIGCEWHPLEQSKVATCGWDGLIKYWHRSPVIWAMIPRCLVGYLGLVASLLYVARCGYHVMNLSLAHGLPHIYSSAPQKPYQPPSSPCFPCGTCRYYPALENNQLQYSIPVASKSCLFG
ncbi:hypothetical protein SO802_010616 [Lithocarpus litseifolius]|uniref:Pre-mRNA-processing factor 17 n=1 Tax=Lithocarpus litseifolius TaxID=425828 RepID=A0AAW2DHQ9_9ROSI